ncbi:MAG: hypothetical protein C4341_09815 [Armatimonadota bacterium]
MAECGAEPARPTIPMVLLLSPQMGALFWSQTSEMVALSLAALFLGWTAGRFWVSGAERRRMDALLCVARARRQGHSDERFPTDDSQLGVLMRTINADLDQNMAPVKDFDLRIAELEERLQALRRINETLTHGSGSAIETARRLAEQNDELEKAVRHLRHLAATDGLTGLANHKTLHDELRKAVAHATRYKEPLSLLMLDVDHFKQFNDKHGHQAGDGALLDIAATLRSLTRSADLCARYGGEEFAVILPATSLDGALQMAERIRAAVQHHIQQPHDFTVSIGVAEMDEETRTAEDLIATADRSLYEAKRRGRNRVVAAQAEERRKGA